MKTLANANLAVARRFRFVHVGVAAMLAAAAATSVSLVQASGTGTASVYVPIAPCRLADTRAFPDTVGVRSLPMVTGEIATFQVWGTNGNCTIPTTATGIATNVTAVDPSASSYLTVYPADAPRPLASNLNWIATSPPTPNQVTVGLSATGAISTFNNNGIIDIIIDIVGYYQPAPAGGGATGPQGPQGGQGPTGPAGAVGPPGPTTRITTAQAATLRWDQDPGRTGTILVGSAPTAAAFDGTNIWVVNNGGPSVSKINPRTNTVTATVTVPTNPYGIAFDGGYMWVTIASNDTVAKINVTSNTVVDTVAVGSSPRGIAFDGRFIWVANVGAPGSVSKIDTTNDTLVQTITAGIDQPFDAAFDGTNIWIVNAGSNNVVRFNAVTSIAVGGPITVGTSPGNIAFDGTTMWVANYGSSSVSRITAATGTSQGAITVAANPDDVAYDGTNIWVTSPTGTQIISPTTGSVVGPFPPMGTQGLVFDGTNMWVTRNASNTVAKLLPL